MTESARRKQRNYRQRAALGLAVLRVPVELHGLLEALVEAGRLQPGACLERRQVEAACSDILHEWSVRWAAQRENTVTGSLGEAVPRE